jgi:hypothetical protein
MALAVEACKELVRDVEHGGVSRDLRVAAVKRYVTKTYHAQFEGCVQQTAHYNNVTPDLVDSRVNAIRPYVEQGLDKLARQLSTHKNVQKLRRPSRRAFAIRKIGLQDDLLGT